jgi:hypothetical protein
MASHHLKAAHMNEFLACNRQAILISRMNYLPDVTDHVKRAFVTVYLDTALCKSVINETKLKKWRRIPISTVLGLEESF